MMNNRTNILKMCKTWSSNPSKTEGQITQTDAWNCRENQFFNYIEHEALRSKPKNIPNFVQKKCSNMKKQTSGQMMPHLCVFLLIIIVYFPFPFVYFFWFLFFHSSSFIFFFVPHIKIYFYCLFSFYLYVLSFSWLYVFLLFLFFKCLFLVFHQCCPFPMYWFFVIFIMFPIFLLFVMVFLLHFFSPSLSFWLCTPPTWHPKKDTNTWFCFYRQSRAGLSQFHKNDILWENIVYVAECKQNLGNPVCRGFRNIILWTLTHQFQRPYNQSIKKGTTQPKNPYFLCFVICTSTPKLNF